MTISVLRADITAIVVASIRAYADQRIAVTLVAFSESDATVIREIERKS